MIHKTDTHKFYSQNLDPQEWSQNLDSLNYFTKFIFTDMIHKIETQIKDSQNLDLKKDSKIIYKM